MVHCYRFERILTLALMAWILVLVVVLVVGMSAGRSSGGEVAMQMFALTLPASLAVGDILVKIDYSPLIINGGFHVFSVWLPFFLGALAQALVVLYAARVLVRVSHACRVPQ